MALDADSIAEDAEAPKSILTDGLRTEEHSIDDKIKADRHKAANNATSAPPFGLRFGKMIPPGTG